MKGTVLRSRHANGVGATGCAGQGRRRRLKEVALTGVRRAARSWSVRKRVRANDCKPRAVEFGFRFRQDLPIREFDEFGDFVFARLIFQFPVFGKRKFLSVASRIAPASALKNCRGLMARLSAVVTYGARARPRAFPRSVSRHCHMPAPACCYRLYVNRASHCASAQWRSGSGATEYC